MYLQLNQFVIIMLEITVVMEEMRQELQIIVWHLLLPVRSFLFSFDIFFIYLLFLFLFRLFLVDIFLVLVHANPIQFSSASFRFFLKWRMQQVKKLRNFRPTHH